MFTTRVGYLCTDLQEIFLVVKYYLMSLSLKYQPSGEGGTRSLPAKPQSLQKPKWPPEGPEMADGVWKGVYPWVFGHFRAP